MGERNVRGGNSIGERLSVPRENRGGNFCPGERLSVYPWQVQHADRQADSLLNSHFLYEQLHICIIKNKRV